MPRALLSLAAALILYVVASPAARADEVFVLDNGTVLRGNAVGQNENGLVIRLADFAQDARITVPPARIVKRYDARSGSPARVQLPPMAYATDAPVPAHVATAPYTGQAWRPPEVESASADEPSARHEDFFVRLGRLALMAAPADTAGRMTLGALVFVALLALVLLGGRLLEIEGLGLAKAVVLAAGFCSMLVLDALHGATLLRADQALWVLPAQALGFIGLTWATLRCAPSRGVLLLAFLGFSLSVMAFAAGAVLMAC